MLFGVVTANAFDRRAGRRERSSLRNPAVRVGVIPPAPQIDGTTYYVAPTGDDANPGTAAAPFLTIDRAARRVDPGDTVIVEDGIYSGDKDVVTIRRGGAPQKWVRFKARNRWGAKLDCRNNASRNGIRFATGVSHVRIEGFEIFGCGNADASGMGIEIYSGGSHTEIIGNYIHHIGRVCASDWNTLENNGIFVMQSDVTIDGNVIHDVGRFRAGENGCVQLSDTYTGNDHGIAVHTPASRVTIGNNIIYNIDHGWAVQLYPLPLTGIHVMNNTFSGANPNKWGQLIVYGPGVLSASSITNNIFDGAKKAGINIDGGVTCRDVDIAHNLSTNEIITPSAPGANVRESIDWAGPVFVEGSFRPSPTSLAIDTGETLLDVLRDHDGVLRPQGRGYDIGAFEVLAPAN